MSVKDIAKRVIDTLPDEATMDDIIHALYVKAKFEHGEQEIRAGKGVFHEEAKKRLQGEGRGKGDFHRNIGFVTNG